MTFKNCLMVCVAVVLIAPSVHAQSSGEQCNWWGRDVHPICKNKQSGWGKENGKKCISRDACLNDQPSDRGGVIGGSNGGGNNGGSNGGGNNGGSNGGGSGDIFDQCNTTAQCQSIYGNKATDCLNSKKSDSVCMCGSERCDGDGGGGGGNGGGNNGGNNGGNDGGSGGGKVLLETGGLVAIEAESYSSINNKSFKAKWNLTKNGKVPSVKPDPDSNHVSGSSGSQYLEILPDTRVKHADKLIQSGSNANFIAKGGEGPTVNYRVYFNTKGTYYVWLRAYSTGSEDNGAHVGINGSWPSSGERVQWCSGKNRWTWSSAQRVESNHCGMPKTIKINVPSKGIHTISVSMREDGFELDKIIMTKDKSFTPSGKSIDQKFYKGSDSGGSGKKLGKFNIDKDMLLACYDNLPDVDDLYSMAALGTMLTDSRFKAVDYFAVVGCRGNQPKKFKLITNSGKLADLSFGKGNWARALVDQSDGRGKKEWKAAVKKVVDKAMPKLRNGGHLWVADAGQSDFSADVVREVIKRDKSINTKNIHVVQHSQWNQNITSKDDLNLLKEKADYKKIADGNEVNNGTPGYKTSSSANWKRIRKNSKVKAMWEEAEKRAKEWNGIKNGHTNGAIKDGGFDFSDTSESVYIFGLMDKASNTDKFFDEFL